MDELWPRLERQLAVHMPELFAALRTGATLEAITAAESSIGVALPVDVRQAYLRHDGCNPTAAIPRHVNLFGNCRWMSLEELVRDWHGHRWGFEEWLEDEEAQPDEEDEGPVRIGPPRPEWIPIAEAGSQRGVFVDMAPGPGGVAGQLVGISIVDGRGRQIGRGLEDYLLRLAEGFEAGRLSYDRDLLLIVEQATGVPFKALP